MIQILKLIISIAASELAGVVGGLFTFRSIPVWYAGLLKPKLSPPNWVFGPVWTLLYLLMGVALYLVWTERVAIAGNPGLVRIWNFAIIAFIIQLVLNVVWSIIFFGLHSPGGAFLEIIFLWLSIAATIILFAQFSGAAAWLLVPYIIWVSFAGYLNYSIWVLN